MRSSSRTRSGSPIACVLGDMDLIRTLGLAGIRCAAVAPPGAATTYSRHTVARIDKVHQWDEAETQADLLLDFARAQRVRPLLYFQSDGPLLMVSRHRDRLREAFDFVIADADLVEALVDKARFRHLAERLELPVPRSRQLRAGEDVEAVADLEYPVVVKPLTRTRNLERWGEVAHGGKAVRIERREDLGRVAAKLAEIGMDAIVQELVEGDETRIESYHAYVDEHGGVAGEFTGRKLRTRPRAYGLTTALEITASPDVARIGLDVLRRLDLRGVAKLDFKRAPDGTLKLLEINARFNLWHHPAAVAGVNLPALVFADLTGTPRPAAVSARPGVRWSAPFDDFAAARAAAVPLRDWAAFTLRTESHAIVALDDPMPFVRGRLVPTLRRAVRQRRRAVKGGAIVPTRTA